MKKEMLINVLQAEECRIAIVENGVLEELYVERTSQESYVGNIYKGRIVNIEPSIQAAFVDFGIGRNGFLHVSDVDAKYYRQKLGGDSRQRENLTEILDLPDVNLISDEDLLEEDDFEEEKQENAIEESTASDEAQDDMTTFLEAPPEEAVELPEKRERQRDVLRRRFDVPPPRAEHTRPDERMVSEEWKQSNEPSPQVPQRQEKTPEFTEDRAPSRRPADSSEDTLGLPPVLPWQEEELKVLPREEPQPRGESRGSERGRGGRDRGGRGRGGRGRNDRGQRSGPGFDRYQVEQEDPSPPQEEPAKPSEHQAPPSSDTQGSPRRRFGEGLFDPEEEKVLLTPETASPRPLTMPSAGRLLPAAPLAQASPASTMTTATTEAARALLEAASVQANREEQRSRAETLGRFETTATHEELPHKNYPLHDEDHPAFKDEDQMEEDPHMLGDHPQDEEDDEDSEEGDDDQRRRQRRRRPRSRPHMARPKPPIQDIFRRGQEVLVQVIKEGLGTKGPTLSTYISIPGRYLVLMPGLNRIGVSRKIPDDEQRKKLREFLQDLKPPQGLGFIIRTAGLDRTKRELHRDLAYLTRLWKVVVRRIKKNKSPSMIYQESDIITRTIRDVFTSEIETIRVDEPTAYEHAQEFLQVVMPRYAERLVLDTEQEPFFHRYGLESEIARIQQRRLPLPQGGSIVIEQTEALVAIDVNSGNFRQDNDAEETAFRVNLTAAKEIARQLRLRDMGGVIIIDFIDMRDEHHRRELERTLRDAVKRDRARTKILKMSQFGIVEMTRQRIRPSLKRSSFEDCVHCRGNGQVKTAESMSIEVMRWLQLAAHRSISRVHVRVTENVAQYLLNRKRKEIAQLEETGKMSVTVFGSPQAPPETLDFTCYDSNGGEQKLAYADSPPPRNKGPRQTGDRERGRDRDRDRPRDRDRNDR